MSANSDLIHDDMKHRFFSVGSDIHAPVTINLVWDGSLSHPLGKVSGINLWTGDLKRYESVLFHSDEGEQTPIKIRLKNYKTGEVVDSFRISNPATLSRLRLTCDILKSQVLDGGLYVETFVMDVDIQAETLVQGGHYELVIRCIDNAIENHNQDQRPIASFVCVNPSQNIDFIQRPIVPHGIIITDEQKTQLIKKLNDMYSHVFLTCVEALELSLKIDCSQNLTTDERVTILSNHLKTGYQKFINSLDHDMIQALCEEDDVLQRHRLLSDRGSNKLHEIPNHVFPEILKNPSGMQLELCNFLFYKNAEEKFLAESCKLQ